MNMHLVDWCIVAGLALVLIVAATGTRRYTKSVGAFLVANRCGRRYIISMAHAAAGLGVISLVGYFEQNYKVGYTSLWWGAMTEPVLIVLALSGWVIYRFRQTRAMTLAQFFEIRYSRRFRIFAGAVAFLAGIINFGIFPAVGARFFMALCGLPEHYALMGLELDTYPTLMALLLSVSLTFTFLGGHIAVMLTDFLQGAFANAVFVAVILFVLLTFGWERISESLLAAPPEESLVHPFHLGQETHFNFWFYLIEAVIVFYGVLTWQGTQGYNACAIDPHEAKMAGILNGWRFRVLLLITIVVPVGVRTLLHHPDFAEQAAVVGSSLASVDSEALQTQMRTPLALAVILPTGLLGLFCAALLAAFISTHDTYLHSWGSILVQDVILPLRKKPFTPRQHLWVLRGVIFAVAVFIFLFSLLFRQTDYIRMFLAITGAIFFGGAGSAIIGGLYWKRGTTAAAWGAMLTGMTLALAGVVIENRYPAVGLTGQEMTFIAIAASVTVYVLVSLLGSRRAFNMDRLLHRGKYAVAGESSVDYQDARTWLERLGIDREFTGWDRFVALVTIGWPIAWTLVFLAGTVYNLMADVPSESWLRFWYGWTWIILLASVAVTVWFTIGGVLDIRYLFRHLRRLDNPREDGRVEERRIVGEGLRD
ncbi:MAG: sodium:solute symporter family protein [Planctomycetota bacterium]|jgi:SSS family solute:Na+ symporter